MYVGSNLYMAAQYDVEPREMCASEVFVWKRVCAGQAPVRSLALKISVILVIPIKVAYTSFESVKTLRYLWCTQNNNETFALLSKQDAL